MPPPTPSPQRSRLGLLLLLTLLLAVLVLRRGEPRDQVRQGVPSVESLAMEPTPATLDPGVCLDAGYLCAGLRGRSEPRILRWDENTSEIHVRIPLPPGMDGLRARGFQDAVAAGILAWQNKPFPIRVERGGEGDDPHVLVRWVDRLQEGQLGRADTEWFRDARGHMGMRVTDFIVTLQDPYRTDMPLDSRALRLTAAHEMGHALGLPHSDSDRDVMYPTNTATSLSARDYRTMEALYALENGALVALPVTPP